MSIGTIDHLGMEAEGPVVDQSLKKFLDQFRIEIPNLSPPEGKMED